MQAVNDVSVEIPWGQTVGVVGQNGSGKSTFLKLVAGITLPNSGTVQVNGRVAPLLELGAGFHPELTGRENVFLTAAVLGIREELIRERLPAIIAFAELEEFIDVPVKFYSTGMFLRLGFSVGLEVDPDILLLDEVMAVGDERFQEKSAEKILEFREKGKTIVFVSHEMGKVRSLCQRVIWLDKGQLKFDGPPGEAIVRYRQYIARREAATDQTPPTFALKAQLLGAVELPMASTAQFLTGEAAGVEIRFEEAPLQFNGTLAIEIQDDEGRKVHRTEGPLNSQDLPNGNLLNVEIAALNLLPGTYTLLVSFIPNKQRTSLEDVCNFQIVRPNDYRGQQGAAFLKPRWLQ